MVGRLSSGEMRSWLAQFLRNPYPLPPDPGSGYERISLTLPRELVGGVAEYLRCSPSEALRSLAQERLAPSRSVRVPSEPVFRATSPQAVGSASQWRVPARPAVMGGQSPEETLGRAVTELIASVITLALVLLMAYFISKSKKQL